MSYKHNNSISILFAQGRNPEMKLDIYGCIFAMLIVDI